MFPSNPLSPSYLLPLYSSPFSPPKIKQLTQLHTSDIPACIPSGQYLLRAEMIALHAASSTAGAQLYMECAQINIVGGTGGTALPSTTYSIPGIYKATDPGLLVNIYSMSPSSTYTIPGPAKFTCSANGGGGGGGGSTTTAKPATSTTSKAVITSTGSTTLKTSVVAPQPTGGCTAAQWAQCGGVGFSGCTTCASPYTCKKQNDYYSQCS